MEANNIEYGVLITADPYSKIIDPNDRNTSLIFGDAAAATLLTSNHPTWKVHKFSMGTVGKEAHTLQVRENGLLYMNGRAIVNFALQNIPPSIYETLEKNGILLDEIDAFFFHQASKYIVNMLSERLNIKSKAIFAAENIGNTVSSTIPLMFSMGHAKQFNKVLVSGFGVGLSWGTTILTRKGC
jgi:3-oxoacyl-[acyl-carrier-protein] synthase-3